ncbi:hypothetical protein [Salinimonas chungwhensis]|uniref:hypothetical protein n=1 Tax=Salinimonas chungwhensis TaxID=265425 RepID=UPI000372D410|nr:hypothetical protein [Salinimonas chungwhensis]
MQNTAVFKFVYILFILTVVFIYHLSGNFMMFVVYLAFGAVALLSVLLHTVIRKLETIECQLQVNTQSGKEAAPSPCRGEAEHA